MLTYFQLFLNLKSTTIVKLSDSTSDFTLAIIGL